MPDVTYACLPNPSQSAWYQPEGEPPIHIQELLDFALQIESENPYHDYHQAVNDIKSNLISWVKVGIWGFKVKLQKLYKNCYRSFQDFCKSELGVSHWRIDSYIKAARVVIELAQAGFTTLPNCEAQAQPLVKFFGEELIEKWSKIVDTLPAHKITKTTIEEVLEVNKPKKATILVDADLADKFRKKASDLGVSFDELMQRLLEQDDHNASIPEDKQTEWEEDLTQLVEDKEIDSLIETEIIRTRFKATAYIGYLKRTFGVINSSLLTYEQRLELLTYLKTLPDG